MCSGGPGLISKHHTELLLASMVRVTRLGASLMSKHINSAAKFAEADFMFEHYQCCFTFNCLYSPSSRAVSSGIRSKCMGHWSHCITFVRASRKSPADLQGRASVPDSWSLVSMAASQVLKARGFHRESYSSIPHLATGVFLMPESQAFADHVSLSSSIAFSTADVLPIPPLIPLLTHEAH